MRGHRIVLPSSPEVDDRVCEACSSIVDRRPVEDGVAAIARDAEWVACPVITEGEKIRAGWAGTVGQPIGEVAVDHVSQRPEYKPLSGRIEHPISDEVERAQVRWKGGVECFLSACKLVGRRRCSESVAVRSKHAQPLGARHARRLAQTGAAVNGRALAIFKAAAVDTLTREDSA